MKPTTNTPTLRLEKLISTYLDNLGNCGLTKELQEAKNDWAYVVRAVSSHEALLDIAKLARDSAKTVIDREGTDDDKIRELFDCLNSIITQAEKP